jgi:hypothetical protein
MRDESIGGDFLFIGAEGLEPPNNGAKNRRLTTWPCPKLQSLIYYDGSMKKSQQRKDAGATLPPGASNLRQGVSFHQARRFCRE